LLWYANQFVATSQKAEYRFWPIARIAGLSGFLYFPNDEKGHIWSRYLLND